MRRPFVIGCGFAFVAAACQLFVKIEDEPGVEVDDGSAATSSGSTDPCAPFKPPGPPTKPAPGTDKDALTFAVKSYAVKPDDGRVLGYDLDDRCTGYDASAKRGMSCASPNGTLVADDDGGIDNAFAQAIGGVGLSGDFGSRFLNDNVDHGIFTLMIQLSNWNGGADDDEVYAALFTSYSLCRPYDAGDQAGQLFCFDGGEQYHRPDPQWDGRDVWSYVAGGVDIVPDDQHRPIAVVRTKGVVTNHKLVIKAGPTDPVLKLGLGSGAIQLATPVVTADIVDVEGGAYALRNGVVAGAAPIDQMLAFVDQIEVANKPLCDLPPTGLRSDFEGKICALRDLNLAGNAAAPCDAISFAFGFDAEQSQLGGPSIVAPEERCPGATVGSCSP